MIYKISTVFALCIACAMAYMYFMKPNVCPVQKCPECPPAKVCQKCDRFLGLKIQGNSEELNNIVGQLNELMKLVPKRTMCLIRESLINSAKKSLKSDKIPTCEELLNMYKRGLEEVSSHLMDPYVSMMFVPKIIEIMEYVSGVTCDKEGKPSMEKIVTLLNHILDELCA